MHSRVCYDTAVVGLAPLTSRWECWFSRVHSVSLFSTSVIKEISIMATHAEFRYKHPILITARLTRTTLFGFLHDRGPRHGDQSILATAIAIRDDTMIGTGSLPSA